MKRVFIVICTFLLAFGLSVQEAEAKRLGGGMSRGMQRDSVTQRQATPPQSAPAAPQAAPQPYPQTPRRSWMGPLAGLAAGIGLGALLSHFGMGEGVANFVMLLLLAAAAVFVFKLLTRRTPSPQADRGPLRYAGVNQDPMPDNRFQTAASGGASSAAVHGAAPHVPAGFDTEGFLRVAKVNFLRLQAANDAGNLEDIREFTTPEMFAEIKLDIDDRRGAPQQTDVVTLEAELLEVVTEPVRNIASVRFHGMVREEKDGPATAFDEVWNLVKPTDGSRGWQIAGIQQLNG